jgi:hypothetical protein
MRSTELFDRTATLLAGVTLAAAGAASVIWATHRIVRLPDHIDTTPALAAASTPWWPWSLAAVGGLLLIFGFLWLLSHLPTRRNSLIQVAGELDCGTIRIDLDSIAAAAAAELEEQPGVDSARARTLTDCGTRTVDLTVTLAHPAVLPATLDAITATCTQIATATGDPAIATRTTVRFGKSDRRPRVPA